MTRPRPHKVSQNLTRRRTQKILQSHKISKRCHKAKASRGMRVRAGWGCGVRLELRVGLGLRLSSANSVHLGTARRTLGQLGGLGPTQRTLGHLGGASRNSGSGWGGWGCGKTGAEQHLPTNQRVGTFAAQRVGTLPPELAPCPLRSPELAPSPVSWPKVPRVGPRFSELAHCPQRRPMSVGASWEW